MLLVSKIKISKIRSIAFLSSPKEDTLISSDQRQTVLHAKNTFLILFCQIYSQGKLVHICFNIQYNKKAFVLHFPSIFISKNSHLNKYLILPQKVKILFMLRCSDGIYCTLKANVPQKRGIFYLSRQEIVGKGRGGSQNTNIGFLFLYTKLQSNFMQIQVKFNF